MAHAHHFLERLDRVTRAQTEFALELYRDHEAVAYVLDRAHLPEGAERVALSLDDPREGPFVLVTRDGRFVTCLGRGMHHELPIVPRAQLDALLAKVADKRARRELAQRELRPDEEEGDLFHRLFDRGMRLAREDFLAITAFEAMLGTTPYYVMLDLAIDVINMRAAMAHGAYKVAIKGSSLKAFERLDRLEWAIAHLMVLSAAGERRSLDELLESTGKVSGAPTFACAVQAGSTFFLRSAWAAARLGKPAIPVYREALATAGDWMQTLDAAMGLGAIGLRHAGCLAETRRILQGFAASYDPAAPESKEKTRATAAAAILDAVEHADERAEITLKIGRDFCVTHGELLPEGHPCRFTRPEDVPDDLARTAVLFIDGNIHDANTQRLTFCALSTAARASAEDFYYPREVVRAFHGQWSAEETLDRLKRFADAAPKQQPVRADKTPGRNEPCPCGSGKKYKKCHGGVAGAGPIGG